MKLIRPAPNYLGLLVTCAIQGLVSFLVLVWLSPIWNRDVPVLVLILVISVLLGGLVFLHLRKTRIEILSLGFVVVGILTPWIVVLCQALFWNPSPGIRGFLTLFLLLLWTVVMLGVSIGTATIYVIATKHADKNAR